MPKRFHPIINDENTFERATDPLPYAYVRLLSDRIGLNFILLKGSGEI